MSCTGINTPTITGLAYGSTIATNTWPADWAVKYPIDGNGRKLGSNGSAVTDSSGYLFFECLPGSGDGFTRDSDGSYSSKDGAGNPTAPVTLTAHVTTLLSRNYPVTAPATGTYSGFSVQNATPPSLSNDAPNYAQGNINPALAYAQASEKLRVNLRDEYCYYYNRYYKLLEFILTVAARDISDAGPGSAGLNRDGTPYKNAINSAVIINNKLNDLILIMKHISISRNNALANTYYSPTAGVNQVNNDLETARRQLQADVALLKNSELKVDVQSAMMDYTIEKNQSSRNLLAIYGFMNIVAVGMLYYLYRNSK
jgi:hypothetical protein